MLTLVKPNDPEFIEAVPDIPDTQQAIDNKVLSNDQLIGGGMIRTTSWVHATASKNALRLRKAKEKAEAGNGEKPPSKQLNIAAPVDEDARKALKNVSALLLSGDVTPADLDVIGRLEMMRYGVAVDRIYNSGGLRARLLRRLLR